MSDVTIAVPSTDVLHTPPSESPINNSCIAAYPQMNLDQLTQEILRISAEGDVLRLATLLLDWKSDDTTVRKLHERFEQCLEGLQTIDSQRYALLRALWTIFRESSIDGISGMTMNERLYCFSLMDRFDSTSDPKEIHLIYQKLHTTT